MVCHFGLSPSEYWRMTPAEVAAHIEVKRPKTIGGVHEDDIESMLRRRAELEAQGVNVL